MLYCFLVLAFVCMYVYVIALFLAMCSWVDVDPSKEPQYQYLEHPSSDQFEQQQEQFEEGKYNMNNWKDLKMPRGGVNRQSAI